MIFDAWLKYLGRKISILFYNYSVLSQFYLVVFCHVEEHFSTLLLKVCNKKQENQAAIFNKSSIDAAQNAFTMFISRTPLSVT